MGHHVDVVGLGPAGDLHRLGQAADVADVDAVELGEVALDEGEELPLGGKLLADREGGHCHVKPLAVRIIAG